MSAMKRYISRLEEDLIGATSLSEVCHLLHMAYMCMPNCCDCLYRLKWIKRFRDNNNFHSVILDNEYCIRII